MELLEIGVAVSYLLAVGMLAASRDRNIIFWPIFCTIFPVLGLLLLALMPNFGKVKCPNCGHNFTINDTETAPKGADMI